MIVPTPETTTWVPLSKPRKRFENFLCSIRFQHDLRGFNRVPLWDIHQEMNMVHSEAEIAELEPKSFHLTERFDADVDVRLFSETSVPVVGDKHHGHPVVAGVTRNLFRAAANYIYHTIFCSCRVFIGQADACRTRQKSNGLAGEKRRCDFSSAGLTLMLQTTQYSQSQLIKSFSNTKR